MCIKDSKTNSSFNNFFDINIIKCNSKKNLTKFYSKKWIVITTYKNPNNYIESLLKVPDPWKIVVVQNGKIQKNTWESFDSNKLIYLSIEDQNNLCYQTTNYIPIESYARKNIGYLYAIQHGAEEIFETDDDFIFKNYSLLDHNFSNWRLYYANNESQMINPYYYFGRPDIWPRGFRISDIYKNNTNNIFSAMKNQFNCDILIIQGIINNPDLDSLFLLTRNNTYNNYNSFISLYNVNPILYLPGNYVPINSKNTKISYDIFPSIALPTTVSRQVSDIWRGYIMQRFAWGYGGVALYSRSEGIYMGEINNISLIFEEEKDLFFKLDSLLNNLNNKMSNDLEHPSKFFIRLIENLVKNKLLKENDLNMYKAFIYDLESFGFKYRSNYTIKINKNYKKYLKTTTDLQYHLPSIPNIHTKNNKKCKLIIHYTIKNKYNDILLIINYNYEFLTKLNTFLMSLYQEYFPKIIFVTPGNKSTENNVIACPKSHKGYYSYICIKEVYDRYPNMKGYLFVMDDAFIKVWELENFNFDIPWIMTIYVLKTKYWFKSNDNVIKILNKNPKWKNNLQKFYNSEIIGHGISDFFYLPNSFVADFHRVATELYKYRVFLELAVPTIYGIISNPLYQLIHFSGLWNDKRKNWLKYLRTVHRQTVIHPIKFSDINNQKEVIDYLFFKNAIDY